MEAITKFSNRRKMKMFKTLTLHGKDLMKMRKSLYVSNTLRGYEDYINDCYTEVRLMKSILLHESDSLYVLLKSDLLKRKPAIFCRNCSETVLNHILDVSTTKGYPIYRDVIASKLRRSVLLRKVLSLGIYAEHNGRKTFLVSDTISQVIKQLDKIEILNLLLAYSGRDPGVGVSESSSVNNKMAAVSEAGCSSANEKSDLICGIKKARLSETQKSAKKFRSCSANSSESVPDSVITKEKKTSNSDNSSGRKVLVPEVKSSLKSRKHNCISTVGKSTKVKRAASVIKTTKGNNSPLANKVIKKNCCSSLKSSNEKDPENFIEKFQSLFASLYPPTLHVVTRLTKTSFNTDSNEEIVVD